MTIRSRITEIEWRKRYRAHLVLCGADDAIADTEMDVLSLYDGYGYALSDCPEEAAEDEMAEWRDE